ncbi:MAG: formate dehydrogenase accessory sulfurtransferase FdhD [Bacteroidetes bacterium]|nr:formate dehydrogenase accessory sulfurtransferase FdhD [Bacteroidota bacterium]
MSTAAYTALKYLEGECFQVDDILVVEEALKITINNTPFTVTMCTPGSENELVRGLLLSENVYSDIVIDPITTIQETNTSGFVTSINVTIPIDKIGKGFEIARSIISVSSCGICGKSELDTLPENADKLMDNVTLDPGSVTRMFEQMSAAQNTFRQSGGSHAAAAFTMEEELLTIQEDIGRHNAVDKVIGSLLLQRQLSRAKVLVVSGRISYEIVNKCFAAGIPFLAAVSAPSSLAVDLAERLGITLMAFCREDKFTTYSGVERLRKVQ